MYCVIHTQSGSFKTREENEESFLSSEGLTKRIEEEIKRGEHIVCTLKYPSATRRLKEAALTTVQEFTGGDDNIYDDTLKELKRAAEEIRGDKIFEMKFRWNKVIGIGVFDS